MINTVHVKYMYCSFLVIPKIFKAILFIKDRNLLPMPCRSTCVSRCFGGLHTSLNTERHYWFWQLQVCIYVDSISTEHIGFILKPGPTHTCKKHLDPSLLQVRYYASLGQDAHHCLLCTLRIYSHNIISGIAGRIAKQQNSTWSVFHVHVDPLLEVESKIMCMPVHVTWSDL